MSAGSAPRAAITVAAALLAAAPFLGRGEAAAQAGSLTGRAVNDAAFGEAVETARGETVESTTLDRPLIVKLQILLDRRGFSVGPIDGRLDGEVTGAIRALEFAESLKPDGRLDEDVWAALAAEAIEPALVDHRVEAPQDAATLAGRFHMDPALLAELNPGKDPAKPGTVVAVADPGEAVSGPPVARLELEPGARRLNAFDAEGGLLASYPVALGDAARPRGRQRVVAVTREPAAPAAPAGVRIALGDAACEIRGRAAEAEPAPCLGLAPWDAEELAGLLGEGAILEVLDGGTAPPAR